MKEVNNIKVIGIDHGFGNIKTAERCFRSGVTVCEGEPTFKANLLVYEGQHYLIGEDHKEFAQDKMRDEDYYILTLAASENAKLGKLDWLRKYLPEIAEKDVICIVGSGSKVKYIREAGVLVDDSVKNTRPWEKAGYPAVLLNEKGETVRL